MLREQPIQLACWSTAESVRSPFWPLSSVHRDQLNEARVLSAHAAGIDVNEQQSGFCSLPGQGHADALTEPIKGFAWQWTSVSRPLVQTRQRLSLTFDSSHNRRLQHTVILLTIASYFYHYIPRVWQCWSVCDASIETSRSEICDRQTHQSHSPHCDLLLSVPTQLQAVWARYQLECQLLIYKPIYCQRTSRESRSSLQDDYNTVNGCCQPNCTICWWWYAD